MTPALTAEEWAKALDYQGRVARAGRYPERALHWLAFNRENGDPHAVAALCLYGQPFGFTPDDVYKLGHVRHYLERGIGSQADLLAVLDSITAKIAALLPEGAE